MFDHPRMTAIVLLLVTVSPAADADEYRWFGEGSWYAGMRAGYLSTSGGEGRFAGPTQSVYGGSPLIEMDDGMQYAVAIGREIFDDLHLELELSFLMSQTASGAVAGTGSRVDDVFVVLADVDSTILMANVAYDFNYLDWWAKPYVRGGIGLADTDVDANLSVDFNSAIWRGTTFEGQTISNQPFAEGNSSEFAWNVAAGFRKELAERWALRLEYSFLDRGVAWSGVDENGDAVRFSDRNCSTDRYCRLH
ncbi:MAG: outer membrane beta-barrel protein [Pseudomonadota bacterium]